MLKIWGREDSLNVQKVMLCVRELGLPHEHINAGRHYGIIDEPWYLEMNPNGLIPAMDDDGFTLWESNTIVKYLCTKYGLGDLCPEDMLEYTDADRWMAWQGSTLGITMRQILLNLVRTPPDQQNQALIDELIAATKTHWTILNGRLEGRDYIMGPKFTMVDIVFAPHVYRWFTYPIDRMELPHLKAWYDRLSTREHYNPCFTAGDVVTGLKSA
jgi:glutathione S-transferase